MQSRFAKGLARIPKRVTGDFFSSCIGMPPKLSPDDLQELMRIRNENDQKKDLHRIDIERTRTETRDILRERQSWEEKNRKKTEGTTAFEEEMKTRFPYLYENSPMLFKLALEQDPAQVSSMVDLVLGNIAKARQERLNPEQCSLNVDRDLTALYYHRH